MKENVKIKNVKNQEIKNENDKKVLVFFEKNKKMCIIIGSILIIALVIILVYFVASIIKYKKYAHYEDKMDSYGFDRLYNNGSAKSSESVTKSEAIKLVIGTCLNTFDISGFSKIPTEEYDNAIWVLYAQDMGLVDSNDLNKDTVKQKVKYVNVIKYFANAKEKLLHMPLTEEKNEEIFEKISDLPKYTKEEQIAIIDLVSNDILKEFDKKINGNKNICKGQLNEIVVNYIEKYELFGEKIQTDESRLPSNASEYAYISENVAKEVYEIPFKVNDEQKVVTPKECFSNLKAEYAQLIYKVEKYYNTVLNIDYATTTTENLKNNLYNLTLMDASEANLNEYVEYIKTNQIKITGNAKVQTPIIYDDGMNYRFRAKLEFKIESSLTNDNLLYGDLFSGETIRYDNKDYSIIVDVGFGSAIGTTSYYMQSSTLDEIIVGNKNPGVGKPYATNDFK